MTTDFENELRDLFREKAEEPLATPSLPASAPRQVLRRPPPPGGDGPRLRGRRRRAHRRLGRGLTRILGEGRIASGVTTTSVPTNCDDRGIHAGKPLGLVLGQQWPMSMVVAVQAARERSACLVVPGDPNRECANPPGDETVSPIPVPHGLPMLQLSNTDLGLTANACRGSPDTAVLYVALDHERMIANDGAALPPFPPGESGLPPATGTVAAAAHMRFFTVNGYPMFAWVGVEPT